MHCKVVKNVGRIREKKERKRQKRNIKYVEKKKKERSFDGWIDRHKGKYWKSGDRERETKETDMKDKKLEKERRKRKFHCWHGQMEDGEQGLWLEYGPNGTKWPRIRISRTCGQLY
jgi:hypothetical protein